MLGHAEYGLASRSPQDALVKIDGTAKPDEVFKLVAAGLDSMGKKPAAAAKKPAAKGSPKGSDDLRALLMS